MKILLIDDEPSIRVSISAALTQAGHDVTAVGRGQEALGHLSKAFFDLVICDINLPDIDGLTLFRQAHETAPHTDFILITAYGAVSDAVAAIREGAADYMTKPFELAHMVNQVDHIQQRRELQNEISELRSAVSSYDDSPRIVGRSPAMINLMSRIDTFAASDAPVLITGESGTGKELVARKLHEHSSRCDGPFVAINCAAFPETLIEAELFGHERGAFTGAVKRREGRFKAADGGTLFLDEVAEIPLPAQAKLLRVLQEEAVEPLGTNQSVPVDVRIISATHRDLRKRISERCFREDLFYRLKVLELSLPPLRDRIGDMPLLVEYYLHKFCGESAPRISSRAWASLNEYRWPGNVRELEHAIHHAAVLSQGEDIQLKHLPTEIASAEAAGQMTSDDEEHFRPLSDAVKGFEREYLLRALRITRGKKAKAAGLLGISRKNLWEKLRALNVNDSDWVYELPPQEQRH